MNRHEVIEIAYETIKDNLEWASGSEDKTLGYFMDGVVSMTDRLLDAIEGETEQRFEQ